MDYTPLINVAIMMNVVGAAIFGGFVLLLIYMITTDIEHDAERKRKLETVDWEPQPRKLHRVE
jgi:hypothetical protein